MINYEASAINSNITLLEKMNKIEKYLLENQLGNVFVTYQTLADDRLSDSDIEELNDRVIGKGDLLIDNDGYLYVITGFNEHTIYIDFNNRIKLGDRLDQAELDQIQEMINDTFKGLNPISISPYDTSINGNESDMHNVAIGDVMLLKEGTNPTAPATSVYIGYEIGSVVNTGDTMHGESNVEIGHSLSVHGDQDVVIGSYSSVDGYRSTAIGEGAIVSADNAVQIGSGTNSADDTFKFKSTTIIDGNGKLNIPNGSYGTTGQILTKMSNTENDYEWQSPTTDLSNLDPISIGKSIDDNTANVDNVAIGDRIDFQTGANPCNVKKSIVIGHDIDFIKNNTDGIDDFEENVIIGGNNNTHVYSKYCVSIGYESAMKQYSTPTDNAIENSIAIGKSAICRKSNGIAIGNSAWTSVKTNNVAIGYDAHVEGENSIQLGTGLNQIDNSLQFRTTQIIDGNGKLTIPNGLNGTTGQVLTKISNAENDYEWQNPQGGGGSGKTFDIPMLINYTADESFSNIMNTPTTIVIDDQQTMQGLNLETQDADFSDYENKTSIYGYTYFTTGGDTKTQIVYGVIAESSTPGTYEFTGLMPLAPEITM